MTGNGLISRRAVLQTGVLGTASLLLPGCDRINASPSVRHLLERAAGAHEGVQRLLDSPATLATEFSEAQMSPLFRTNGSTSVADPSYRAHLAQGFAQWTLRVDGLVHRQLDLPLAALQALPQRSQITRHDCVEGWSAIAKWQGPQLGAVLALAGLMPTARYVVFHCADLFAGQAYYESIDLIDAFHPQTLLAWRMNDQPLREEHGAPLRLRVERQLGYKQAKFVMRLEVREHLHDLHGGRGGYWEDSRGYLWYAGI